MPWNGYPPGDPRNIAPKRKGWGKAKFVGCWLVIVLFFIGVAVFTQRLHENRPLRHYRVDLGDGREVLISSKNQPYIDSDKWGGGTTVVIGNHRWDTQGDVHVERLLEGE